MGHIELAAPCSHIWYFKGIPSRMGLILDISPKVLEKVLYFAAYIVTDPGDAPLARNQVLTEKEYRDMREKYEDDEDEIVYASDANETVVGSADEVLDAGFVIDEDSPEDIMDVFGSEDDSDADDFE